MDEFRRYAVYYMFPDGPLADFGQAWLGWDAVRGRAIAHPPVKGCPLPITQITDTPRKYGLHGTLKAPFRLARGTDRAALEAAVSRLACEIPACRLDGLELSALGGFLALTPSGDTRQFVSLAARIVGDLDRFRAPPDEAELARRRKAALTPEQEANLLRWGYPYVMDAFRFHITLSGQLSRQDRDATLNALRPHLTPLLPNPFEINGIALTGEAEDGRFHLIHRYSLTG